MEEIEVHIEAEINPTEDEAKVKRAVENLFGNVEFKVKPQRRGSLLVANGSGMEALTKLQNLLRRERIRDAARTVLYAGLSGSAVVFYLNKQVAYAGHVSFSQPLGESALGAVRVEIRCSNLRAVVDSLAPRTA